MKKSDPRKRVEIGFQRNVVVTIPNGSYGYGGARLDVAQYLTLAEARELLDSLTTAIESLGEAS